MYEHVRLLLIGLADLVQARLLDSLSGFIRMQGQVDGPEKVPLGAVGLILVRVVGEVVLELGVLSADLLVEVLDGDVGEVELRRVGFSVGHELLERDLLTSSSATNVS